MDRGDRNGSVSEEADAKSDEQETSDDEQRDHRGKRRIKKRLEDSESESEYSDSDSGKRRRRRGKSKESSDSGKRGRRRSEEDSDSEFGSDSEDEEERRRRKRREKRKRRKREEERERKRRKKEKERKRRKEEEKKRKKDKKKKEKMERGKKGAVTDTWGKYGIIREIDMWNKRPEFTAWLLEIKQVNLESLPNWEEKQLFKQYMEDYNTATFPSKKYYNLDVYHGRKMEKEMKKGMKIMKKVSTERTVFDDEEQRRLELLRERERQKEEEVQALKRSMQSGMAQAMKEQAQLREEMAYQYKLGNFEAAAAIQRRLDPDVAL